MSRSIEKSKETWSALVHNKDITSNEVLDAYKDWAKSYEPDLLALHPDSKYSVGERIMSVGRMYLYINKECYLILHISNLE